MRNAPLALRHCVRPRWAGVIPVVELNHAS
jgi:hypothetical protein